mgnify:CR=1 FL=1
MIQPEKIDLGIFPTRILHYPQLGDEMGINLFIKNEYESDVLGSGNKVRKLEYLLHTVKEEGHSAVILAGIIQSNCCMAVSHYAPLVGLSAEIILVGTPTFKGNHLQTVLSGARITYLAAWDENAIEQLKSEFFHKKRLRKEFLIIYVL